MPSLRAFGYWKSEWEPELPEPGGFVGEPYDMELLKRLSAYLLGASVVLRAAGQSWCRFGCGEESMGRCDHSDGVYIWPEGLVHYMEKHAVRLPAAFEHHILTALLPQQFSATELTEHDLDFDWPKK